MNKSLNQNLASLTTTAKRDGNYWIINGTKTWTTKAHWSDWCFLLARTSNEDRKQQGLVLEMAVRENMSLASLGRDQNKGFLNHRREQDISREMVAEMKIKTPSDLQEVQYLSGSNQQKVVLGKWLAMKPRVLFLDEPTRGIDVGAKQEIYELMDSLAAQGMAVLFVSSEMEEIISMSDRAIVMHEGQMMGELTREELTEEAVMRLATGTIESAVEA